MTRLRIGALLVVAAAAFTASAAGASGRGPVSISAVDSSGFPLIRATVIAPRGSRTVRLSENGKPAVGLTAINLGKSKAIVLAVDRSESMRGRPLANAIAAAKQFVSSTGATDHVGVVVFGRSAISLTHGEAGPGDAQSALSDVTVDTRSGTALYDAIVSAAGELRADSRPGRAIVVITDGKDVSSLASVDAAIRAAQGARASVYTIGIGGPSVHTDSPAPHRLRDRRHLSPGGECERARLGLRIARERARADLADHLRHRFASRRHPQPPRNGARRRQRHESSHDSRLERHGRPIRRRASSRVLGTAPQARS